MKRFKILMLVAMAATFANVPICAQAQDAQDANSKVVSIDSHMSRTWEILTSPMEWEIWAGVTFPMNVEKGTVWGGGEESQAGIDSGMELRYNLPNSHFALGGQLSLFNTTTRLANGSINGASSIFNIFGGPVVEYNLFPESVFNPYISLAGGASVFEDEKRRINALPYVRPRIGIEIKHCFRIGGSFYYSSERAVNFGVHVAAVIGGWPQTKRSYNNMVTDPYWEFRN